MAQVELTEVFTLRELARATGATRDHLDALVASGQLRLVPGTRFVAAGEAVRMGRRLRSATGQADMLRVPAPLFARPASQLDGRRAGMPVMASSFVHLALLVLAVVLTTMDVGSAVTEERTPEPARLVFLLTPGPGGGGGGGGLRSPLPPPRVERRADTPRRAVTVPAVTPRPVVSTPTRDIEPPRKPTPAAAPVVASTPVEREPEPLPSNVLVAPVVAAAADSRDRDGLIDGGRGNADSHGSGAGGGVGAGHGTGNGGGLGTGIGDGSGGGTGGGPYRPGSGIEPPRLQREVKAEYTDDARRRGISGDVLLEIVVRADGSVGQVTVMRGLGSGLDQRAVQAVRQWRFDPARRKGAPVDVMVEVAVEFILR